MKIFWQNDATELKKIIIISGNFRNVQVCKSDTESKCLNCSLKMLKSGYRLRERQRQQGPPGS